MHKDRGGDTSTTYSTGRMPMPEDSPNLNFKGMMSGQKTLTGSVKEVVEGVAFAI